MASSSAGTRLASHPVAHPAAPRARSLRGRSVRVYASAGPNDELLGAFFYGRAFVQTVNERIAKAAMEAVSDIGNRIATRPQRIQSFQEEVAALAEREMVAATGRAAPSLMQRAGSSSSTSSGSGGSGDGSDGGKDGAAGAPNSGAPALDAQERVDDLRATIAEVRAMIQQLKAEPADALDVDKQ